jgi:hypothetical protein
MLPQPGDLLTRLRRYKADEAAVAAGKEEAARVEHKLHTLACNMLCLRIKADGIVTDIGNLRASKEETAKLQRVVRQLLRRMSALELKVAGLQERPDTTAADLEKFSGEMAAVRSTIASVSISLKKHSKEMAAAEPAGVAAVPSTPGMTALVERLVLGTQAAPTAPAAPPVAGAHVSAAAPPFAAAEAPAAAAPAPAAPNVPTAAAPPASPLRDGNVRANKAAQGGTANAADRRAHAKAAKPPKKTANKIPAGPAAAAPAAAAEVQRGGPPPPAASTSGPRTRSTTRNAATEGPEKRPA